MKFPKLSGWSKLQEVTIPLKAIFDNVVAEHENNPVDEKSPRDFIDNYMTEIKNTTDPNSSFYKEAGRKLSTKMFLVRYAYVPT